MYSVLSAARRRGPLQEHQGDRRTGDVNAGLERPVLAIPLDGFVESREAGSGVRLAQLLCEAGDDPVISRGREFDTEGGEFVCPRRVAECERCLKTRSVANLKRGDTSIAVRAEHGPSAELQRGAGWQSGQPIKRGVAVAEAVQRSPGRCRRLDLIKGHSSSDAEQVDMIRLAATSERQC